MLAVRGGAFLPVVRGHRVLPIRARIQAAPSLPSTPITTTKRRGTSSGGRLGGERVEIRAGESVLAPRRAPHGYWNAHAAPTRYLVVMTSWIRRPIEALHAGDGRDFAAVFRDHASELLI